MKTTNRPVRIDRLIYAGLLLCASVGFAANKNPTSKLYIADLQGQSEIDTGDRIEEIRSKSVHNAQGTVIETSADANNSMVFSNGTGVFLDADTRMEVRRFVQEPFTPNRTDLETEPSISQTYGFIPRGRVGICAPKMVAGSSMTYATPHAAAAIRGKKVVVQADDFETTISSVEGEVTITGEGTGSKGQTIKDGEQAIISRLPGQPPSIQIRPIPEDQIEMIEEKVTMACNARRTVYFDIAKKLSDFRGGPDNREAGNSGQTDGPVDLGGGGNSGGFGEIFLDDPAGEDDSEFEIITVVVSPVRPPQEVVGSPSRIVVRN